MKKRSFWSILLFAGMIIAAGVGFNSCEKSGGTSGGGGGSSSGGGGGGGGTVTDSLKHCWEISYTYAEYPDETYIVHEWATKKDMDTAIAEAKKEGYFAKISYKESTAKTKGECDALDIDENEKMCWKLTYTYKGESQSETWYEWATLKEVKEGVQEAEKAGNKLVYELAEAYSEESCDYLNGKPAPGPSGEMWIKCAGNGWEWEMMDYIGGDTYTYTSWVASEENIGANINSTGFDQGAIWYDLGGDYSAAGHGFSYGQAIEYIYTGSTPDHGTLEVIHPN